MSKTIVYIAILIALASIQSSFSKQEPADSTNVLAPSTNSTVTVNATTETTPANSTETANATTTTAENSTTTSGDNFLKKVENATTAVTDAAKTVVNTVGDFLRTDGNSTDNGVSSLKKVSSILIIGLSALFI